MVKSHKPIVWGPFAAGGTLAALVTPVMVFITGIAVPIGIISADILSYERSQAFANNWLGKIILFAFVVLPAWHAAHRARITFHDLGVRADIPVAISIYTIAATVMVIAVIALQKI